MNCPHCEHHLTDVVDTRTTPEGDLRRRRRCRLCGGKWSTVELAVVIDGETDFRGAAWRMAFEQVLIRRARVAFRARLRDAVEPIKQLLNEVER